MESSSASDAEALALVHQGWNHLQLQRPLAAWASWQQALRLKPDDPAATEALELLASSPMLPAAARKVYRLRGPDGADRLRSLDQALRTGDLTDLANAEQAFTRLATSDPGDAAAWYNLALCRAWQGNNVGALVALHHFVATTAEKQFDDAADAWALGEVLRHGAGAEPHADDLSWSVDVSWDDPPSEPKSLLDAWPHRSVITPANPLKPGDPSRVHELLNADDFDPPRVEATLVVSPGRLHFSTLWPDVLLDEILRENRERLGLEGRTIGDLEAHVLPLHLLDSQAWAFRLPEDLDPESRSRGHSMH